MDPHSLSQFTALPCHTALKAVISWYWIVMYFCFPSFHPEYTLFFFLSLFQFWKLCLKVWTMEGSSQPRGWHMVSADGRDSYMFPKVLFVVMASEHCGFLTCKFPLILTKDWMSTCMSFSREWLVRGLSPSSHLALWKIRTIFSILYIEKYQTQR